MRAPDPVHFVTEETETMKISDLLKMQGPLEPERRVEGSSASRSEAPSTAPRALTRGRPRIQSQPCSTVEQLTIPRDPRHCPNNERTSARQSTWSELRLHRLQKWRAKRRKPWERLEEVSFKDEGENQQRIRGGTHAEACRGKWWLWPSSREGHEDKYCSQDKGAHRLKGQAGWSQRA